MAVLNLKLNPGANGLLSGKLDVDGEVCGGISKTCPAGPRFFSVHTNQRVPALDDITGESIEECWNDVRALVKQGGVVYRPESSVATVPVAETSP